MNYFIDTEFIEKPNTIDLISIGIVGEDGSEYYAICRDFNLSEAMKNEWIVDNVLKPIYSEAVRHIPSEVVRPFSKGQLRSILYGEGKSIGLIRKEILEFVDDAPKFYGYYADYDWVVFCWIFGRMIDLPKHFPMYCRDLKQMMDERILPEGWKVENCPDQVGVHNALIDSLWKKKLYDLLIQISV